MLTGAFNSAITEWAVKIWQEILQQTKGGEGIAFKQPAVRYYWKSEGGHVSKCADDPIESARERCQKNGTEENIELR